MLLLVLLKSFFVQVASYSSNSQQPSSPATKITLLASGGSQQMATVESETNEDAK